MSIYATRAAAGAALLDQVNPQWYRGVNITTLSIVNPEVCILAQVYGDYQDGLNELGIDCMDDRVTGYGFCSDVYSDSDQTAAWRTEVRTRIMADHAGGATIADGRRKRDYVLA